MAVSDVQVTKEEFDWRVDAIKSYEVAIKAMAEELERRKNMLEKDVYVCEFTDGRIFAAYTKIPFFCFEGTNRTEVLERLSKAVQNYEHVQYECQSRKNSE